MADTGGCRPVTAESSTSRIHSDNSRPLQFADAPQVTSCSGAMVSSTGSFVPHPERLLQTDG